MSIFGRCAGQLLGGVMVDVAVCAAWYWMNDGQRQSEAARKSLQLAAVTAMNVLAVVPAEIDELARLDSERLALMDRRQRLFRQLSEELQGLASGGAGWGPKAAALRAALDEIESRIEALAVKGRAYGDAGSWGAVSEGA